MLVCSLEVYNISSNVIRARWRDSFQPEADPLWREGERNPGAGMTTRKATEFFNGLLGHDISLISTMPVWIENNERPALIAR